jgi:HAE1 family hydrophobic/amphiphilic exporter-1
MPRFSIRNPYFIIVICLALTVIGVTSMARMPVDLFPVTNPLERFFTLAAGIDHTESRSLSGVSIIMAYLLVYERKERRAPKTRLE